MGASTVQIARQGRVFLKKETTFGTVPSLSATNFLRHKSITFPGSDVKNKRMIVERQQSPFPLRTNMTDQRKTASFNYNGVLRPSGTINTVPELDPLLECAFGAVSNVTLATTVASGGTTTGATLTSTTGLLVGHPLLITCPDGKKRVRFILTLPGANAVTWAPALPGGQSPANGAAVKNGLLYKLTQQNLLSLSIGHFLRNTGGTAGLTRCISGAIVDKFGISVDSNDDPMFTASGPGKFLDRTGAPAEPGSATQVGGIPPSGIVGELYYDDTARKFKKLSLDCSNGLKGRADSYGFDSVEESYRASRGEIGVSLDMLAEEEGLYALAEAGTFTSLFFQGGFTEGNIIALRAPNVLFKVPDTDDPDDGEVSYPFKGAAHDTSDGAYDSLVLALC